MRIRFLLNISSNMKQFLLLLIMLFSLSCTAQKAFKPVKTALKDKKIQRGHHTNREATD